MCDSDSSDCSHDGNAEMGLNGAYDRVHEALDALDLVIHADVLDEAEHEKVMTAIGLLDETQASLESRQSEQFADPDLLRSLADDLDSVYDLTAEIIQELDEVEDVIDRTGWPEPNPYSVADESGATAKARADELRELADETELDADAEALIEEMEADCDEEMTDGGEEIPLHVRDEIAGLDWVRPPEIINSNGQRYAIGWNESGWFNIVMIEIFYVEETWDVSTPGDYPITSFPRELAEEVVDAIEEGL